MVGEVLSYHYHVHSSEYQITFLKCLFYFILFYLTLQYCIGFAIYQNESATGIHVFPILNPPPSPILKSKCLGSLSTDKYICTIHTYILFLQGDGN